MLMFVSFLPIPKNWASFLCMLTTCLKKHTFIILQGIHKEPVVGYICGGGGQAYRALGVPMNQLPGSTDETYTVAHRYSFWWHP